MKELILRFHALNLTPKIGLELEFYLKQKSLQISDQNLTLQFISSLIKKSEKAYLDFLAIEAEQGLGQVEIKTNPETDLEKLISNLEEIKILAAKTALEFELEADFSPTPFMNDCSSALQINLSLLDENGCNVFVKNHEAESEILLNCISGLLELTIPNLSYFSKIKENNPRFNLKRNQDLFKRGKYTSPVNLTFGYENRSCAIRVTGKEQNRRLEFRIPDSDINIKIALEKFLEILNLSIRNKFKALKPVYGNAFDYKEFGLINN